MVNRPTVAIFDTTLRDGEQAPGFSMSPAEKVQLMELIRKVRDPGFRSVSLYLGALEASAFDNARATVRDVCEDLERIATAAGRQVDLACDGRPG